MNALTMKYRGGWPRLIHLSADYARYSGTTTMCPCGLNTRYTVLSTLLLGGEAWTVYRRQVNKTVSLHGATSAFDHKDNLDGQSDTKHIHERTGLPSMENLLIRKNLRWTGHLMRMSPDRLPKQILSSQLYSGHRKRGRIRLRF